MPRGLPDYFSPTRVLAQRLVDFDVLFLSLYGVTSLDNKGRVYFMDTFGSGVSAWVETKSGDAGGVSLSTLHAEVPPASMAVDVGTLTGVGAVSVKRTQNLEDQTRVGIQFSFMTPATTGWVGAWVEYQDGYICNSGGLRLYVSTGAFYVYTPDGYQLVDTLTKAILPYTWTPVKVVYDVENGIYVRAIIGNRAIDLTPHQMDACTPQTIQGLAQSISVNARDDDDDLFYIGHVILTIEEP